MNAETLKRANELDDIIDAYNKTLMVLESCKQSAGLVRTEMKDDVLQIETRSYINEVKKRNGIDFPHELNNALKEAIATYMKELQDRRAAAEKEFEELK